MNSTARDTLRSDALINSLRAASTESTKRMPKSRGLALNIWASKHHKPIDLGLKRTGGSSSTSKFDSIPLLPMLSATFITSFYRSTFFCTSAFCWAQNMWKFRSSARRAPLTKRCICETQSYTWKMSSTLEFPKCRRMAYSHQDLKLGAFDDDREVWGNDSTDISTLRNTFPLIQAHRE